MKYNLFSSILCLASAYLLAQKTGTVKMFEIAPDIQVEMVFISPGTFTMGNTSGNEDNWTLEAEPHEVTITKGFWMSKYEITQEVWQQIMNNNPSHNLGPKLPVENVSWFETIEFLKVIQRYDPSYDLPTEAQWEYACKAGTDRAYSRDMESMTWHRQNSGAKTHTVGTKEPNLWGLYDLHGNVGEWVLDWKEPFDSTKKIDPSGPDQGERKLIKGGQHTGRLLHTRSFDRQSAPPVQKMFFVGFRIVKNQ